MDSKILNDEVLEVDFSPGMIAQVDIIRENEVSLNTFGNQSQKLKTLLLRNKRLNITIRSLSDYY